jgi:hypothetical protein
MAAAAMDTIIFSDNQPQCLSAESNVSCANCILVKEQLHTALLELKSAKQLLLFFEMTLTRQLPTAPDDSSILKPSLACESSVCEQAGDKWIPVVHNFNKKTKMSTVTSMKTEQPIMSSNRFTPLTNPNENLTDEIRLMCNSEWSSSTKSTKKSTNQSSAGNRIPTIINGRFVNGDIKKPSRTLVNSSCAPGTKGIKYDHKVKIIGDSHLKGSAARINQYLNTKF